jgi:hypothetical protein
MSSKRRWIGGSLRRRAGIATSACTHRGAHPLTVRSALRLPLNTAECPPAGGYIAHRAGPMWVLKEGTSEGMTLAALCTSAELGESASASPSVPEGLVAWRHQPART